MIMMMTFLLVANPRPDASDLQDALNAILSDDETTLPTKGTLVAYYFEVLIFNEFRFILIKDFSLNKIISQTFYTL